MSKKDRPEWMNKQLNNKHIDEILLSCNQFVTDGTIQKIYEYIIELEKNDKRTTNNRG